MGKLNWLYRQINLLSLDVTAGVVIGALFFAKIFQVQIRPQGLITLALTVWVIYTADHLLDAYKIKNVASTERHRFHQQNFLWLMIALGSCIAINIILIFFIKETVLKWGIVLIGIVVVYLFFQKYLLFFKELIAALLYSGGVVLPSLVVASLPIDFFIKAVILQFFITAWFNLVLFSLFDNEKDVRDRHNSFVTTVGATKTKFILYSIFSFNTSLFILQLVYNSPWVFAISILMIMNIVLLIILLKQKWFEVNDRFRLLGDSIFLLPILFLI